MSFNAFKDFNRNYLPIRRDSASVAPNTSTPFITFGDELLVGNTWYKASGYTPQTGYIWTQVGGGGAVSPSGLTWVTVPSATSVVIEPNYGYYVSSVTPVSMTIDSGFGVGSVFEIQCGQAFGGVTISLSPTQTIFINDTATTGKTVQCYFNGSSMTFTCVAEDTLWSGNGSATWIIET